MKFAEACAPFREKAQIPATDLLPLIPVGADMVAQTSVDPSQIGKVPGRYRADINRWSGLPGTALTDGLTDSQVGLVQAWPTENVGLRAARFPGLDIDVASEEVRDWVMGIALTTLGFAPVRVRAGAPRALLVYRTAPGAEIRKVRRKFRLLGQEHIVELLGHGQQYVIAGLHPSGVPYEWKHGADLVTWGADGLEPLQLKDVEAFFTTLDQEIQKRGGEIVQRQEGHGTGGTGVDYRTLAPAVPLEVLRGALAAMPNTPDNFPDRNDLVGVLAAVKAALGRDAEAFREEALDWAVAHNWCDEPYFDKVWDSLETVTVSPGYLLKLAREHGYHGDAALDFPDDQQQVTEEIERNTREEGDRNAAIEAAAEQLVFIPDQEKWVVLKDGTVLANSALGSHRIGLSIVPMGVRAKPHVLLRNSGLVRDVAGITYMPGKPELVTAVIDGKPGLWFNRWRPSPLVPAVKVTDDDVELWLDHIQWLFPNNDERRYLLNWMAFVMQHPGVKIRWAPLVIGPQGIGKDLMLKPLAIALGTHNVAEIMPADLMERFNDYLMNQLVIVQEMTKIDKNEVYERVKALISGTSNGTVRVERKYQDAFQIPNTAAFLFFTNHEDAINLAPDDRRYLVLRVAPAASDKRESSYYQAIDRFYREGGVEKIARWLLQRDITGFDVNGSPLWTEAKTEMVRHALNPASRWVVEAFEPGGAFEGRTVVSVKEIEDHVTHTVGDMVIPRRVREAISPKAIARGLEEAKFEKARNLALMPDGKKVWLWTNDLSLKHSPSVMRDRWVLEKPVKEFNENTTRT
jgi:hypothetical protein